jgi:hypothetical protein
VKKYNGFSSLFPLISSLDCYKNTVVFDFHSITLHGCDGGHAQHCAGTDIEAGTMAGTFDAMVEKFAPVQRTVIVGTQIVYRIDALIGDVTEQNFLVPDFHHQRFAGGDVV